MISVNVGYISKTYMIHTRACRVFWFCEWIEEFFHWMSGVVGVQYRSK